MTTKRSYTKTDLDKYVEENEIELIGEYEKVNRDTKIKGKCKTEGCDGEFDRTFRQLLKTGSYCNKCVNINKKYKAEATNMERYGCISPFKIKESQEKIKNIRRIKIKESTDKFIKQSNEKHKNKYDYTKINYINCKTNVIIICPLHGEYQQQPSNHLCGKGCMECSRIINGQSKVKKAGDTFIEKANILHNNKYDYSKYTYINAKTKSIIICPEHGEFLKDPHHHLSKNSKYSGCILCNKELSDNERIIKYMGEFIKKSNEIHNGKYNYNKFKYTKAKTKSIIICPIHGEFKQCPGGHLTGHGCKKCSIISISDLHRKSNEEFIKEANIIHKNKYDYSKVNYINCKTNIIIICEEHGEYIQNPITHLSSHGCPKCGQIIGYEKYKEYCINNKDKLLEQGAKKIKKASNKFVNEANKKHNNKYDYSKVEYKKAIENVIIICREHGEFEQTPNSHLGGSGCTKCGIIKRGEFKTKEASDRFIEEANKKHNNKYDYTKFNYIKSDVKSIIICPEHGEFEQSPNKHLQGGCMKCGGSAKSNIIEFIEKANILHNNKYDYSKYTYINAKTKSIIICPEHGEFEQSPGAHLCSGCEECAKIDRGKTRSHKRSKTIIEDFKKVWGDEYDYRKFKYVKSIMKSTIICKKHGEFMCNSHNHLNKRGCPKCSMENMKEKRLEKYGCKSCGLFEVHDKLRTKNKEEGLCDYCQPMKTNKLRGKTKEMLVVRKLREDIPDIDFIHNKSVGNECSLQDREDTNGHLYPDIRFELFGFDLIVEVDEHRHRGAGYSCDERRMYDIIAKLGLQCVFIRYNPDDKKSDYNVLLEMIKEYLEKDMNEIDFDEDINGHKNYGLKVEYLFY